MHALHVSFRYIFAGGLGLLIAFAWPSSASFAGLPGTWEGEIEIEQAVPTFSPAHGAVVAATAKAKIPITKTLTGLSGHGTLTYESTLNVGPCRGTGEGEMAVDIKGQLGSKLGSLTGQVLNLQVQRQGNSTSTLRCPGAPAPTSVTRPLPKNTLEVSLPLAHDATWKSQVQIGGTLFNQLTLHLPCDWDTNRPPGPEIRFEPDPRTTSVYSGTFDTTQSTDDLTRMYLRSIFGGEPPPGFTAGKHSRGLTESPAWFKVEGTNEAIVHTARYMGGVCVWIPRITFRVPEVKQYVARHVAQRPQSRCYALVVAHERRHRQVTEELLTTYANKLVVELQKVAGPYDAAIDDTVDVGRTRVQQQADGIIGTLKQQYQAEHKRKQSLLDDERRAENAELFATCGREGL